MRVEQALADFEEMMMTNKFIGEYLKELCDKSPIFRLNGTERPWVTNLDNIAYFPNNSFSISEGPPPVPLSPFSASQLTCLNENPLLPKKMTQM